MKIGMSAGACGLLLVGSLSASMAAGERVLEQSLPATGVRAIAVSGGNGAARIAVGDEDAVLIRVVIRPERLSDRNPWQGIKAWFLSSAYDDVDDLIEAIRLDTDSSGGGTLAVGLRPPRRTRESRVSEDWRITVPRRLAVKLAMARADTEVKGVAGGVDISIGNGSADVDVPGGDLDIEVTVGKADVRTGSTALRDLDLRSEVGDTRLWINGLKVDYPDPPGPGSRISMAGEGDDSITVFVQVGDASLRVNEK